MDAWWRPRELKSRPISRGPGTSAGSGAVFSENSCRLVAISGSWEHALYLYQASGLKWLVRMLGFLAPSKLRDIESLAPEIEAPFFFSYYGKVARGRGPAALSGSIPGRLPREHQLRAARMRRRVRVLQKNGCEVSIPEAQTCCGALHVHAGLAEDARKLARRNIDALLDGDYDAIITNAAWLRIDFEGVRRPPGTRCRLRR